MMCATKVREKFICKFVKNRNDLKEYLLNII